MKDEIHSQQEKILSTLRLILSLLLGLAGIGLISFSGFGIVIVIPMARVHGGNTTNDLVSYLVIAVIGAALLVTAKWIGRRKGHVDRR